MLKLQELHRLADYSDEEEYDGRDYGIAQRKEVMMIRKDNRNNLFRKRRLVARQTPLGQSGQHEDQQTADPVIMSKTAPTQAYELLKRVFLPSELDELIDKIKSEKLLQKLQGALGLRRLLSNEQSPIGRVIQSGAAAQMIKSLLKPQWPQIQFQSAYALADIASGSQQQCQYLISRNCISIFYQLIRSGPGYLVWPCVWFFGNMACDSIAQRDAILQTGVLEILVDVFEKCKENEELVIDVLWAMRNLCNGNPLPKYSLVKTVIEALTQAMAEGVFRSETPFRQALWTITFHIGKKQGKAIMDNNLYLKLVELVNQNQIRRLIFPCLRVIRDLLAFPRNVGKLIEAQVLDGLAKSLKHKKLSICLEACCGLCNILKSKNQDYILQLLKRQQIVAAMKEMLFCESEIMRLEIAVSFCMMCECNSEKLDLRLIELNILADFSSLLTSHNPEIIIEMLRALEVPLMLSAEQSERRNSQNSIAVELNNLGIAAVIQKLQYHNNQEVYKHASRLLETYFILQEAQQPKQTKQSKKERRNTGKSDMWQKKAEYLSALQ